MLNPDQYDERCTGSRGVLRREFLQGSAVTAGAVLAGVAPPSQTDAAEQLKGPEETKRKTFLAIGSQMDDAEIGAGGVLIQAAQAGHRVVIVTIVSDYRTWQATVGREEATKRNLLALAKKYGFEKRFLDYPYHQLHGGDVELKRKLAEIYVELKPQVAFIHHVEDHWPDHVAAGQAAHDALLFSHGLSHDMTEQRCPLIYAFSITPAQTYHFEPDVYYDVTAVMPEYMELLTARDSCLSGKPVEEEVRYEFRTLGKRPQTLRLSGHGMLRLPDCMRFGQIAGCPFALGFRTVWGKRRGENLF